MISKEIRRWKTLVNLWNNSIKSQIPYLWLHGGAKQIDLNNFKSGLSHLLPFVKTEVYIDTLLISEDMLKLIIEKCHKVNKLVLWSWKISISESFNISHALIYKIKSLDLYCSWSEDNSEYIDIDTLPYFIKALSQTNLVESIENIHIRDSWYPVDEFEKVLKKYGFNAKVIIIE